MYLNKNKIFGSYVNENVFHSNGFTHLLRITYIVAFKSSYGKLKAESCLHDINPYKPGVLFMGHRQTE